MSELLAAWRAAERDTIASHAAANVAELALLAATKAEESAKAQLAENAAREAFA